MKFLVKKTSCWCSDNCPMTGAVKEQYDGIERRACSEEEFNKCFSSREGLWRSKGVEHSTYDGGIQRRHPMSETGWFLEIESLDALKSFCENVKYDIIVSFDQIPEIEIYDDYRE